MYVCTQLSAPSNKGEQTCTTWQTYAPVLPDLSMQEWSQIAVAMITILAIAWGFKTISRLVKES